jgi:Flp pilus assembly protein TadD
MVLALGAGGCSSDNKAAQSPGSNASALSAADQLLQDGLDAQGKGQLDVAQQKYLAAVQMEPANKIAHYDLGVVYQQLNDVAGARSEYQKAVTIDANYSPALFNLAVLETTPNPQRAEQLYRQLLTINPNDANVHFNLGLLLDQVGRGVEGEAELQKAFSIDPGLKSRVPPSSSQSSAN